MMAPYNYMATQWTVKIILWNPRVECPGWRKGRTTRVANRGGQK